MSRSVIKDPNIRPLEFCMLLWFQYNIFLQKSKTIELGLQRLKIRLDVATDRTLKVAFKKLQENGYIMNEVDVINKRPMIIELNTKKLDRGKSFTQLPKSLIEKIDVIGHTGLRLLYYYESFIFRPSSQFAYPSFETIISDLSVNKDTIDKYNEILIKKKYLKIEKHHLKPNGQYDDDRPVFTKYNNHYYVQLDKILGL